MANKECARVVDVAADSRTALPETRGHRDGLADAARAARADDAKNARAPLARQPVSLPLRVSCASLTSASCRREHYICMPMRIK